MSENAYSVSAIWADRTRRHYDRLSGVYDALAGWAEAPQRRRALAVLAARPGERVLDVGCGTGASVVDLARAVGETGQVTGLDLSPGMLRVAIRRVEKEHVAGSVRLVEGDVRKMEFADASFDAVYFGCSLELLEAEDRRRALAETRRVLKDGGKLVVLALAETEQPGVGERLYEWLHEKMPAVIDCRPIRVAEEIEAAGFDVRSERGTMWSLPIEIVRATPRPSDGEP